MYLHNTQCWRILFLLLSWYRQCHLLHIKLCASSLILMSFGSFVWDPPSSVLIIIQSIFQSELSKCLFLCFVSFRFVSISFLVLLRDSFFLYFPRSSARLFFFLYFPRSSARLFFFCTFLVLLRDSFFFVLSSFFCETLFLVFPRSSARHFSFFFPSLLVLMESISCIPIFSKCFNTFLIRLFYSFRFF